MHPPGTDPSWVRSFVSDFVFFFSDEMLPPSTSHLPLPAGFISKTIILSIAIPCVTRVRRSCHRNLSSLFKPHVSFPVMSLSGFRSDREVGRMILLLCCDFDAPLKGPGGPEAADLFPPSLFP